MFFPPFFSRLICLHTISSNKIGASIIGEGPASQLMIDSFDTPAVLEFTAVVGNTSSFTVVYTMPPWEPDRNWFSKCQLQEMTQEYVPPINGWPATR
jgi:hypothetical protein